MTGRRIKIKGFALKNGKLVKSKAYYPNVSAALKAKDKKRYGRRGTT